MKKTLTFEQTKRLLAMVSAKRTDKTLVTALLLCGGGARTWTWEDALSHVMDLPLVVYGALKELAMGNIEAVFTELDEIGRAAKNLK